jgi:multiple sugar transport system substrate-binding protein
MGPGGTGTSTTSTSNGGLESIIANPSVPTEYKDFLKWLQSVSGKYKGIKININLQSEPDYRALQSLDQGFYSASGINSQYDLEPYVINLAKTRLAVSTGSASIDVIDFDSLDIPTFKDNLIPPQTLADKYPEITYPGFDMSDFLPTPTNLIATYPPVLPDASTPKGETFCFPYNTPVMIRFYRTDIYSKMGLTPPGNDTWDDYYNDVVKIGTGTNVYGCDSQASTTTPIFHEFTNHLYSFGGRFWDINGDTLTPTINDPLNVQALENFARFFPYTLPNALTNDWDGCVSDLAHGLAANAITFEDYAVLIDDPLRSIEVNNMGYAVNPAGPSGSYSTYVGDGLGISKFTKNPEAAWLWLQWATAQGTQMMLVADDQTRYVPSRSSALNSSFVQGIIATPKYYPVQLTEQILASGKVAFVPTFKGSDGASATIALAIYNTFVGQASAQQALDQAQSTVQASTYTF